MAHDAYMLDLPWLELRGEMDELQGRLGACIVAAPALADELRRRQAELVQVGALSQRHPTAAQRQAARDAKTTLLARVRAMQAEGEPAEDFILPDTEAGVALHLARTGCQAVSRRAGAVGRPAELVSQYCHALRCYLWELARWAIYT